MLINHHRTQMKEMMPTLLVGTPNYPFEASRPYQKQGSKLLAVVAGVSQHVEAPLQRGAPGSCSTLGCSSGA